jgi:DNA-directed RNA polymerase specialized sigma24 family protein
LFTHFDEFRGEASLTTWSSRIAINEALGRVRKVCIDNEVAYHKAVDSELETTLIAWRRWSRGKRVKSPITVDSTRT